ncbi:Prolipoprotein diacylglyceryl transferase [Blattabacterium sp. (Nauphoeta cinerea)]|uniref:prolipoprotein diacylglyceryl transferase n=1 Tax=Blattabacterium sp. (Nauphoeta cinerea) TaxID=1316444 RepID=UPI0003B03082|nr:prolipoprotein diacylglyceryl transferase [Blattabacterium sp. (Nauphoeta cinerea)]AGW85805.1 Prolipoprotein diacylglyceryl transferase [Blattabacterium sp. (Nauphoeta cinerea)]
MGKTLEYINWDPIHKFVLWKGFCIHIYSLMFVISFLLGWYIMKYIYQNDNIDTKYLDPLFICTFLGTLIGARLGQVLFYDLSYFSDHWIEAILPIKENKHNSLLGFIKGYEFIGFRGLSSHGATIGIILSSFFYKKIILKKKSFIWLCDRLCIPVSISAVFIRVGNFFNSEIVGKPCNEKLPWSVKFIQMDTEYGEIVPRHPAQIYESIGYFVIFLLLWYFYKIGKKNYDGFLSGIFFILLWSIRFLLEFVKEPQGEEFINFLSINTGQWLSIPFIILGFFILNLSKIKKYFFS